MSHTPGPWTLVFDVDGVPGFIWGKTMCICDFGKDVPKPEDARLIAAAPELYEAIQAVDMALTGQKTSLEEWANTSRIVRAALAKARGDEGEDNA